MLADKNLSTSRTAEMHEKENIPEKGATFGVMLVIPGSTNHPLLRKQDWGHKE